MKKTKCFHFYLYLSWPVNFVHFTRVEFWFEHTNSWLVKNLPIDPLIEFSSLPSFTWAPHRVEMEGRWTHERYPLSWSPRIEERNWTTYVIDQASDSCPQSAQADPCVLASLAIWSKPWWCLRCAVQFQDLSSSRGTVSNGSYGDHVHLWIAKRETLPVIEPWIIGDAMETPRTVNTEDLVLASVISHRQGWWESFKDINLLHPIVLSDDIFTEITPEQTMMF